MANIFLSSVILMVFILFLASTSSLMKFLAPGLKIISSMAYLFLLSWGSLGDSFPLMVLLSTGLWTVCLP